MGGVDGLLRIIDLETPYFFNQIKLDTKQIISIDTADYKQFGSHNICIAMTSDCQIFFAEIETYEVVYILKPTIITCDTALSFSINTQYTHLMQTTEGGYIIFWELKDILTHFREKKNKTNR